MARFVQPRHAGSRAPIAEPCFTGLILNYQPALPPRVVKTILQTGLELLILVLALLTSRVSAAAGPGAVDSTYAGSVSGLVSALGLQPDGRLVVGGSFTVPRTNIARLWPNGAVDTTFQARAYGGAVSCVAIQRDGRIVIGGSFIAVNGITQRGVARLNANGALDRSFIPPVYSSVYAVAVQTDNKVIVAGGSTGSGYVSRLNADGSPESSFPTNLANDAVYSVALQPDGQILVGGSFTTFNGVPRGRFARLTADGWLDPTFGSSGATGGAVQCIQAQRDGDMVIVGQFTTVNKVSCPYIARLTSYGGLDSSFVPATINGSLYTAVVQPDGRIIAGGYFSTAGSANIVRFNANGTIDTSFESSAPPRIYSLALQNDSRIIAGGGSGPYLMRVYGDLYPPELTAQPTNRSAVVGTDVTLAASVNNPTPASFQWHKDGIDIFGATGPSYTVYSAQLTDSGTYSVTAFSGAGSTTSTNAVLKVGIVPSIALQPYPIRVPLGGSTNLAVAANGAPLSYIWVKNGAVLPGATSSVLSFPSVVNTNYGSYYVIVSNFLASVMSTAVGITPLEPVPTIITQPQSQAVAAGNLVTLSVVATNATTGYTWRKDGIIVSSSSSYVILGVMPTHAGNYTVAVTSSGGSVTSSVAVLTVITPPSFTIQPKDCNTNLGAIVTFTASAGGSGPLSYQWRKNGLDVPGATDSTLTLVNVQMDDGGSYSTFVSNPAGGINSSNAILRLDTPPLIPSTDGQPSKSVVQPGKPDTATAPPLFLP